ncbi:ATP-binding protein [Micromonospora siamensis]|uniref:Predicted ATPase n=1 Tax=Micromonospora siamensis TaxID=299152 RepID=A0A1C5GX33_9ACTN|nr:helix-turn-helix domain-containing protein [Micromonospora siamensis]SCG38157.1 Predicted ATPase [Micromonospora siamensis]
MTPDHDPLWSTAGPVRLPDLLHGHRRAAGLTQAELAARAGVGVRTVRDLERGRSARPQRNTVELLAGALGLGGADRAEFLAAARRPTGAEPAPAPAPTASGTSVALPPPADLTGRERDVAELAAVFTDGYPPPVVSLVGLAGVGKTALALAVAHRVAGHHSGGVAGVLVSEGSDSTDVLCVCAAVFDAARVGELAARLAGRPALLLLDAIERAPEAVAEAVRRLAVAAPTLRVLVTGRHPLGLPGERVWPVTPLDVPPADVDGAGAAELDRYPAVALFTARLAQVRREPPAPAELPALAALVRRLGGLPLAIELMAARGRVLDLTELLDRYGHRVLDLAAPGGNPVGSGWEAVDPGGAEPAPVVGTVTLREAVAVSYRLLDADERWALRRLSAFWNRWSVELAEELLDAGRAGAHRDAVPLLDRLLELGLLSVRGTGPFRFRLLDAVRDFAAEQAAGAGESTAIRRRHAEVLTGLVVRTAPELAGPALVEAVHRLDEVTGDLGPALAHAAVDEPVTALRLAVGLSPWWRLRGRDVSGRQWLRRLLADPRTADADPTLRAWALLGVARLAAEHGAAAEEVPAARAALAVFQAAGDVPGELAARTALCALLPATGEHDEAREQGEVALALAARHGRTRDMAMAHRQLSWHDIRRGDLARARRRLAAVDRLAAQVAERRLRVLARAGLAEVTRLEGRYADAVEVGWQVAAALAELGDPGHRRRVLGTVGLALARGGRHAEAQDVVAELRGSSPAVGWAGSGPEDGVCALIEGHLALHRGHRELAAEWFAAAAESGTARQNRRESVEALVGLAASTGDPVARDRLDRVCRSGGISLLPIEEELLAGVPGGRPGPTDGRGARRGKGGGGPH